jgi:hypothetical protein
MCVIVAYKLDGKYVLAKNRDRNYVPTIDFKKRQDGQVEYRTFLDKDTLWSEGINSRGICIVNSSLMVVDDEKQIAKSKKEAKVSHDGDVIKSALKLTKIINVVKYIVNHDVFGFTFVTNGTDLYVIENIRTWDKTVTPSKQKGHDMKWFKVDDDTKFVVRSNHGEYFSESGYLMGTTDGDSSRKRREYVEKELELKKPKTIKEILTCMRVEKDKNPNNNPIRRQKLGCKLFTTGQYALNPENKTFYYVPVHCKVDIDSDKYTNNIFTKEDKSRLYVVKALEDLQESYNSFRDFYKHVTVSTI